MERGHKTRRGGKRKDKRKFHLKRIIKIKDQGGTYLGYRGRSQGQEKSSGGGEEIGLRKILEQQWEIKKNVAKAEVKVLTRRESLLRDSADKKKCGS